MRDELRPGLDQILVEPARRPLAQGYQPSRPAARSGYGAITIEESQAVDAHPAPSAAPMAPKNRCADKDFDGNGAIPYLAL